MSVITQCLSVLSGHFSVFVLKLCVFVCVISYCSTVFEAVTILVTVITKFYEQVAILVTSAEQKDNFCGIITKCKPIQTN